MTVSEVCHIPTDDLASPSKFYPLKIHVPHHQLRNFISVVNESKVYYVHNFDIFVLDLEAGQKSLVATVPFEARCLAAAHGWICVGGEMKGDCAFVRIAADETNDSVLGLDLVVDMLGTEIVNSMTIHQVHAESTLYQDEVVVLISNNDKSVTLYSLSQQEVLAVLEHPVPMNYASMSPDSRTIATIGDSDEIFFYAREATQDLPSTETSSRDFAEYSWQKLAVIKVPSGEGVWDDYGFAVTFSPNGKMCAVSAQGGCISVIDMDTLLSNPDRPDAAIRCSFKSSRPGLWGCVRSMAFAPAPWDLLAWTEDHGRIGIADVRQSFTVRQSLSLNRDAADVVQVEDVTPAEYNNLDVKERLRQQHLHRMRAFQTSQSVDARSLDGSQNSQTAVENPGGRQIMDLDQQERSVFEALETTMDDLEHYTPHPHSINYTSTPTNRRTSINQQREYDVQLLNPRAQLPTPRRRRSVVLSETTSNAHLAPPDRIRAMMTESPAPMSAEDSTLFMSTNDLTPTHNTSLSQPMPYNIPPSDPWHVIEAALSTNRDSQMGRSIEPPSPPRSLTQIESAIVAERRIANRLERQLADERRLSATLRIQIEARERLLEVGQQSLRIARASERRLSPSFERVLHRQLQIEQENGQARSHDLESEIQLNSQRVNQLTSERELLLNRLRQANVGDSQAAAATSSLSTTTSDTAEIAQLEALLSHLEGDRQTRQAHIQELESQVRRAESRIELVSLQSGVDRGEQRERHHERLLDARFLSAGRSGATNGTLRRSPNSGASPTTTSSPGAATNRVRGSAIRRAEAAMNSDRASSIPLNSELAGRVSDNEMRLARMMLQRAAIDANGNWVVGHGLQRILGPGRTVIAGPSTRARSNGLEEVMRDRGVGTAGIGWSSDGRFLYVGSEAGIFQFKTHIKARMCFPSIEMR